MVIEKLDMFIDIAASKPKKKIVVAAAEDEPVLQAVAAAVQTALSILFSLVILKK